MSIDDTARPIEILLVEDNPGDVRLAQEILREARVRNHISTAKDGVEALAFLRHEHMYTGAPRPDLILLDLNLPKKDGRELLADIKTDRSLRSIPVIVLTTSQDERDVLRAYEAYANCYIVKPIGLEQSIEVVRSIEQFWFQTVRLPLGEAS
jgi:two-component system, chemotaxis family, response regulator Rcp1